MTLFVKRYADPIQAAKARANYEWLFSLNSGVLLPDLVGSHGNALSFSKLDGTRPGPGELVALASTLGALQHAAAQDLATARLDRPHTIGEHTIDDFTESRRAALHRTAATRNIARPQIDDVLDRAAEMAPAFYKDSNLRNFILTDQGIAVVDFDDLTIAPHGYDLAKLLTSIAMTFGRLSILDASAAQDAYNAAVGYNACDAKGLAIWVELNWLLTADYVGRNGYEHPWPKVRPWANPFADGA